MLLEAVIRFDLAERMHWVECEHFAFKPRMAKSDALGWTLQLAVMNHLR